MRKKHAFGVMTAVIMAMSLSITSTAATHENIGDYDSLSKVFIEDTDAEVNIKLSGNIENTNGGTLTAGSGQSYKIDGKDYTMTDMSFNGSGNVEINANVEGKNDNALHTEEEVSVVVNGDVTANEDEYAIKAEDSTSVTVNGTVKSEGADGVNARDYSKVIVNGDAYGGSGADGVDASDEAEVIVNGDVYGGDGQAPDEDGNLYNGNINDPFGYSDGGAAVEASDSAKVTVNGNAYGGDSYGTYGYAGAGVDAMDYAQVEVTGDSKGGNQITNPDVVPEKKTDDEGNEYYAIGYAGDGVLMDSTANVTIGGDAIGGNSNANKGLAGCGVYVVLELTANVSNESSEIVVTSNTPGKLLINGSAIGGEAEHETGLPGNAIYYSILDENPVEGAILPDVLIEQICSSTDYGYIRECVTDMMSGQIFDAGIYYMDNETCASYQEKYKEVVFELAKEYGVDTESITDYKEAVALVSDEKISDFAAEALNLGNNIIKTMCDAVYAVPEMEVGALEVQGEIDYIQGDRADLTQNIIDEQFPELNSDDSDEGDSDEGDSDKGESSTEGGQLDSEVQVDQESAKAPGEKMESEKTESEKIDADDSVPETGDYTQIGFIVILLIASALVLLGRSRKQR